MIFQTSNMILVTYIEYWQKIFEVWSKYLKSDLLKMKISSLKILKPILNTAHGGDQTSNVMFFRRPDFKYLDQTSNIFCHGGGQTSNIWISRLDGFPVHSGKRPKLTLLSHSVQSLCWMTGTSVYSSGRENSLRSVTLLSDGDVRFLPWNPIWNFGDSSENLFESYGDSSENLFEFWQS